MPDVKPNFSPDGLWAFRDISFDPHNSRAVRIRFSNKATKLHKAQLLDAVIAWMHAQKFLAANDGKPPTAEQLVAMTTPPKENTDGDTERAHGAGDSGDREGAAAACA
jgi:hypothetical protein